jgi:hypothetical protein
MLDTKTLQRKTSTLPTTTYGLALGCTVNYRDDLRQPTNTKDGTNEGWENERRSTARAKAREKPQTEPRDGRNPTDGTKEPNTDGRADTVIETEEELQSRRTLPTRKHEA